MAQKAGKIRREHGTPEYRECLGKDLKEMFGVPFFQSANTKPDETTVFSWIAYKPRAHHDRVNAEAMKDPRRADSMDPKPMPFDAKRMVYSSIEVPIDA